MQIFNKAQKHPNILHQTRGVSAMTRPTPLNATVDDALFIEVKKGHDGLTPIV
ncbi:MAG: hypothetical protein MK135_11120 [Polyangiaceae bacterium]|nr:hypothetical protein [Polyangiaceae bacterium]